MRRNSINAAISGRYTAYLDCGETFLPQRQTALKQRIAPFSKAFPTSSSARLLSAILIFSIFAVVIPLTPLAATRGADGLRDVDRNSRQTFLLQDLSGRIANLAAYQGRIVFLHFFATWCESCREELPALERFVDRSSHVPVVVFAISVGEPRIRVGRFFSSRPANFEVLIDSDGATAKAWDVIALPTTYVLDANLTPRFLGDKDLDWDRIDLGSLLDELKEPR